MTRGATLLALAGLALATFMAVPAAAATGPRNSWTQLINGNWPWDTTNPNCSPCVRWPDSAWNDRWSYDFARNDDMYWRAAKNAVKEWSGEPFRSPVFYYTGHGCISSAYENVCLTGASMDPDYCGNADVAPSTHNELYYAHARLNTSAPGGFYDGNKDPNQNGCNVRHVWMHEVGHAFAEGHSATTTDLMCSYPYKPNGPSCQGLPPEHVDADAKAMVNAVYGPPPGDPNDCPGCPSGLTEAPGGCPTCSVWYIKAQMLAQALAVAPGDGSWSAGPTFA